VYKDMQKDAGLAMTPVWG